VDRQRRIRARRRAGVVRFLGRRCLRVVLPAGTLSGGGQFERRDHLDCTLKEAGGWLGKDPGGRTGDGGGGEGGDHGRLAGEAQRGNAHAHRRGRGPTRVPARRSRVHAVLPPRPQGRHRCVHLRLGGVVARQECCELGRGSRRRSVGHHPQVVDEPRKRRDVVGDRSVVQRLIDGGVDPDAGEHFGGAIVVTCHRGTPSCSRRRAIVA
jgi:hypothetical protein